MNDNLLPENLWSDRDAAIAYAHDNSLPIPDVSRLQEWLEDDGYEALIADFRDDFALNIRYLAQNLFRDGELRSYMGHDDDQVITDQMRVEYARERIENALSEVDGYIMPSIHTYLLELDDKMQAYLGCTIEIHGQGGPAAHCHGVFKSREDFLEHLEASGYWVYEEFNSKDDESILALWQH